MSEVITPVLQTLPQLPPTETRLTVCDVVVSVYENELTCSVNGKLVDPIPFSLDLIRKLFPERSTVLFNVPKGCYELTEGRVEEYYKRGSSGAGRPAGGGIRVREKYLRGNGELKSLRLYSDKPSQNRNSERTIESRAKLFEVKVRGNLYTYILAFPDGNFIRTPLRRLHTEKVDHKKI